MPQDPPDHGVDPDEQPTQPLPEVQPEAAGGAAAAGAGADAPTVPFEPKPASTEPIAPYVPIADYSSKLAVGDGGGGAAPPPPTPDRKSPVPWLIGAAVAIMAAAVALAIWQPWADAGPAPTTSPDPSVSVSPTIPPVETPTEEPGGEPSSPPDEPAPEPTPPPAPEPTTSEDPSPTSTTPSDTPTSTAPTTP